MSTPLLTTTDVEFGKCSLFHSHILKFMFVLCRGFACRKSEGLLYVNYIFVCIPLEAQITVSMLRIFSVMQHSRPQLSSCNPVTCENSHRTYQHTEQPRNFGSSVYVDLWGSSVIVLCRFYNLCFSIFKIYVTLLALHAIYTGV